MSRFDFFNRFEKPVLFAHRGCSYAAPENTLAAFQKAKEFGIPGIELDVRLCASGEMVVFHDDDFKRIFDREGTVEETSFEDLRKLDAGIHRGGILPGRKSAFTFRGLRPSWKGYNLRY